MTKEISYLLKFLDILSSAPVFFLLTAHNTLYQNYSNDSAPLPELLIFKWHFTELLPMMHSTKIEQMVLLRQTKGPPEPKIRNVLNDISS